MNPVLAKSLSKIEAIVIGSSAGGIEALKALLPVVKKDFPAAVVVVQHIGHKSATSLVPFFQGVCGAQVKEVEDKEAVIPGTVYFAPAGYHILLESDHTFALSVDAPVSFSRPSIDVLMESAADAYGEKVLGIVLTGANQDGAVGLSSIISSGGIGVVQDPKTAAFATMPESAIKATTPSLILGLPKIAELLESLYEAPSAREV